MTELQYDHEAERARIEGKREAELRAIGKAALANITELVAAISLDWERLTELREERDTYSPATDYDDTPRGREDHDDLVRCKLSRAEYISAERAYCHDVWASEYQDEAEELETLEAAAGDCEDRDEAFERLNEDPLSVQIRSGWHALGERPSPEEFEILLATGGPAVRIVGELDASLEPMCAHLEVQNWFTPWTFVDGSREAALEYASHLLGGGVISEYG